MIHSFPKDELAMTFLNLLPILMVGPSSINWII